MAGLARVTSVLVILACSILGSSIASAQTKIPIRAAYIPVITWLPMWIAKDQGFFDKHGLDVSLTVAQNPSLLMGTLGRQFDIVPTTPPDLIKAVANGLNVIAIAGGFIESSQSRSIEIIVRKDSGINKPEDLAGKLVASAAIGSAIHVATLHWLKTHGVQESAIRAVEVPFPNMADQLKNGRIDAVESVQPFVGLLLKAGNVTLGDPILAVSDPVMGTVYMSDADWARSHKDIVDKWIASLQEAVEFIKAHHDVARETVATYTKLPQSVVAGLAIPPYEPHLTGKDLESWTKMLHDLGQIQQLVPGDKLALSNR